MMEKFPNEINAEQNKEVDLEGISFETPLGQTFEDIDLEYNDTELSVRDAFPKNEQLKDAITKAKSFRDDFPGTFNGILLGNPDIKKVGDNKLDIRADQLHYYIYFAAHQQRQEDPEKLKENYVALSVCGTIYDKGKECFYMSIRPSDSQEDAGKIDAPGGILNPDFKKADPFETINDRFNKKLGLDISREDIKSIGIERIFDDSHSLYNIAMYTEVDNKQPEVDSSKFTAIPLSEVEDYLQGDKLASPARATLLLALSQEQFKDKGWGEKKVKEIIGTK